jgi:hypothetical protein
VGLVNVLGLKAAGLGNLGAEQPDWLKRDLAGRSASTPIVLFAHLPLWSVYPDWGWGTDDGEQARSTPAANMSSPWTRPAPTRTSARCIRG